MDRNFFESNRQSLRSALAKSIPIILSANGLLQRNSDVTYPFRQDSSFWYLTGVDLPDFTLVIDEASEYLIAPQRSEVQNVMDGSIDLRQLEKLSGLKVLSNKEGWSKLKLLIKNAKEIAGTETLPAYLEKHGFYPNPARKIFSDKLLSSNTNLKIFDIREQLADLRAVKQSQELKAIREAIEITTSAINSVKGRLKNYSYEYEVEAEITSVFISRGSRHAFTPIVAAGGNAATIHYTANSGAVKNGQLLLLDVGAEVYNYAADLSRTVAVGKPTKRQKAVYQAVLDAQGYGKSQLKPGVLIKELEEKMEKYMGNKLRELNLIKSNKSADIRKYYPHASSHFLGLDTHDLGNYYKPIQPNMVITVEPGIYIREENIGVRLEDDVLITKNGAEVLSDALSLDLS